MIRQILPATLAAVGVTVCQLHGGPFWVLLMGGAGMGWTVSALWEGMSVWLWLDGSRRWWRWVPTAFLLLGMIYQSGAPFWAEFENATATAATQTDARKIAEALLTMAVDQERRGWKDSIDRATTVLLAPPEGAPTGLSLFKAVVPFIGFPAMYAICLVFINGLSVAPRKAPATPLNPTEALARRCRDALQVHVKTGKTYAEIAGIVGLSKTQIANLINRDSLRKKGGTLMGRDAITRCAQKLGVL